MPWCKGHGEDTLHCPVFNISSANFKWGNIFVECLSDNELVSYIVDAKIFSQTGINQEK